MKNFDNIDEYVTGKMTPAEREAFEESISSDPSLQSEVAMQKAIVEAVKKARMAELKGMLSQIPVTGLEVTLGISVVKIAATVITAGALVGASVFYLTNSDNKSQVKTVKDSILEKIEIPATSIPTLVPKEEDKTSESAIEKTESTTANKSNADKTVKTKKPAAVSQPKKIEVIDPTTELTTDSKSTEKTSASNYAIAPSHIPVETHDGNKKYSFHYEFSDGKLILYGAFDKGLYEVLEVNGSAHSLFLFYKDQFYLLNEKQKQITALRVITDQQLISKLKEYRSR